MGVKKINRTAIRSMTGFGKAAVKTPYGTIEAEIKTLNHKNLSIVCAPFEGFFLLEEKLKDVIAKKILRGKVLVRLSRDVYDQQKPLKAAVINEDLIRDYVKKARKLQKKYSVSGDVTMSDILKLPGVIEQSGKRIDAKIWPFVKKVTEEAVARLVKYREDEGRKLYRDLSARIAKIRKALDVIKERDRACVKEFKASLEKKVRAVKEDRDVDRLKIEEEVALFARNCDISEEVVRLSKHINGYMKILRTSRADVGKTLDFIAQEMQREINTIGAKANDYKVSSLVIEIKSEIEKSREQLRNIE